MVNTPRDPVLAIRIPNSLKEAIATAARQNDRTPSQEVRRALRYAYEVAPQAERTAQLNEQEQP